MTVASVHGPPSAYTASLNCTLLQRWHPQPSMGSPCSQTLNRASACKQRGQTYSSMLFTRATSSTKIRLVRNSLFYFSLTKRYACSAIYCWARQG